MATSVNQYDFLKKTNNVGLKDFRNLNNNKVYTMLQDLEDSVLGFGLSQLDNLKSMMGEIGSIVDMVMEIPGKILDEITKAINNAVNWFMNLPFVGWGAEIFNNLIDLDRIGVTDFIKEAASVGSAFFCANLDTIKDLLNGLYIPDNIMEGLFLGLSLDWKNRMCKPYTPDEVRMGSNREVLELMNPYGGTTASSGNILDSFKGLASGYFNNLKSKLPFSMATMALVEEEPKQSTMKVSSTGVIQSEMFSSRNRTRRMEDYTVEKQEEAMKAVNLPRAKDALGTFLKNCGNVDMNKVITSKRDKIELSILDKLVKLQPYFNSGEFNGRTNAAGQFNNFDFESFFSNFTKEEIEYLKAEEPSLLSHRYNGLHPTTEMFIFDNVPYVEQKSFVNPGDTKPYNEGERKPLPEVIIA